MELGYILTAVFAVIWVGFKVYETVQAKKRREQKEEQHYEQ